MGKLKILYDEEFKHIKFDKHLIDRIRSFANGFMAKNNETIMFFGSMLLGYYPVRWNYSDSDKFWDTIFEADPDMLEQKLHKVPAINPSFNVSSDVFNNTIIYFLHRVETSEYLTDELKRAGCTLLMFCMNTRFICSLMARYFKYPSQYEIAVKTAESMTMRYDLRDKGSWGKMLKVRSENFTAPNSLYYKTFFFYNDDYMVVKMINDAQGRIRDTVKDITALYYKVLQSESRIYSNSSTLELEGEVVLKDLVRERAKYVRVIKNALTDAGSFTKYQLDAFITTMISSIDIELYTGLRNQLLEDYIQTRYRKEIDQFIEDLITYSLEALNEAEVPLNDLSGVLNKLRNIYMSGRVSDNTLLRTRKTFQKFVTRYDSRLKHNPVVQERTGLCLYIILRALVNDSLK